MTDKILFVDDEPAILDGISRLLRGSFHIDTAVGPQRALEKVAASGPYAVVVSDMRMPGMNGVEVLTRVRKMSPDTVRIILTGYSEIDSAIAAVNEGSIFRFLTKPCDSRILGTALNAALAQYRLVNSERDLLENTLGGAVQVLVEVLSIVNPAAFSKAMRIRNYVRHVATEKHLPSVWRFEVAAMLSQLGCVTLDTELLDAINSGKTLTPDDDVKVRRHPQVARDLLMKIPRMEPIAWIVGQQMEVQSETASCPEFGDEKDGIVLGAQILRAALAFDDLLTKGLTTQQAIEQMLKSGSRFEPSVVSALATVPRRLETMVARKCLVADLACGMVLNEEVRTKVGLLVVTKGQEITQPLLLRLRDLSERQVIDEYIMVLLPAVESAEAQGSA